MSWCPGVREMHTSPFYYYKRQGFRRRMCHIALRASSPRPIFCGLCRHCPNTENVRMCPNVPECARMCHECAPECAKMSDLCILLREFAVLGGPEIWVVRHSNGSEWCTVPIEIHVLLWFSHYPECTANVPRACVSNYADSSHLCVLPKQIVCFRGNTKLGGVAHK